MKSIRELLKPTPDFYQSKNWLTLRMKVLETGRQCACCRTQDPQVIYHVDHIKPRSLYPELELEFSNLQVLCADCNRGKSNRYTTDWRARNLDFYKGEPEKELIALLERKRSEYRRGHKHPQISASQQSLGEGK